jgi:hypothetical protein
MPSSISTIAKPRLAAALVVGLLAVAAFIAMAPAKASAGSNNFQCEEGEFCLGYMYNLSGGLYQNVSSDSDLRRHTFYRYLDPSQNTIRVALQTHGNSWSAYNYGKSALLEDVLVYSKPDYQGRKACIARGTRLNVLPDAWKDQIMSFQWVTSAYCPASIRL